jgi:hypothetical protein
LPQISHLAILTPPYKPFFTKTIQIIATYRPQHFVFYQKEITIARKIFIIDEKKKRFIFS